MSPNASITTEPQVDNNNPRSAVPPEVSGRCGKTLDDCKLRFGSGALPLDRSLALVKHLIQDWQQAALQRKRMRRVRLAACSWSLKVAVLALQKRLNRG